MGVQMLRRHSRRREGVSGRVETSARCAFMRDCQRSAKANLKFLGGDDFSRRSRK